MKKMLVIGVIILFIGLACAPSINANESKERGNEPPYPPYIDGPIYGKAGVEYIYTFVSDDPEADYIWYYIEWGDGNTTGWIGYYESGEDINRSHSWSVNGTYEIRAKAKDFWNESRWEVLLVSIGNHPPNAPKLNGPTVLEPDIEYEFGFVSEDPDGDNISYFIDWGDGSRINWTDYIPSGVEIILKHTYYQMGTLYISAKAKDIYGAESDWSFWSPKWKYKRMVITFICGKIESYEILSSEGAIRDVRLFGDNISMRGLQITEPYGWKNWIHNYVDFIRVPRYLGNLRFNHALGIAFGNIKWS